MSPGWLCEATPARLRHRAPPHPAITSQLQTLGACLNKPFKNPIKRLYMEWMRFGEAGSYPCQMAAMLCTWNTAARRSNLVFLGIADCERETWQQSEDKVIEVVCTSKLNIRISSTDIERALRTGKYHASKNRPVIAKLTCCLIKKQQVPSNAKQLKGSNLSVSEDFRSRFNYATTSSNVITSMITKQKALYLLHSYLLSHLRTHPSLFILSLHWRKKHVVEAWRAS